MEKHCFSVCFPVIGEEDGETDGPQAILWTQAEAAEKSAEAEGQLGIN